jgi:rhodanese-related sulfurtransferase
MLQDQITSEMLEEWLENDTSLFLLDVRTLEERQANHIGGHWIPLADLPNRLNDIPDAMPIVIYCRSGARSQTALEYLKSMGYQEVYNLIGGILSCKNERLRSD